MMSSRQDKVEGALDIAKGQNKKTIGALTGDEGKKGEDRKHPIKGVNRDIFN